MVVICNCIYFCTEISFTTLLYKSLCTFNHAPISDKVGVAFFLIWGCIFFSFSKFFRVLGGFRVQIWQLDMNFLTTITTPLYHWLLPSVIGHQSWIYNRSEYPNNELRRPFFYKSLLNFMEVNT